MRFRFKLLTLLRYSQSFRPAPRNTTAPSSSFLTSPPPIPVGSICAPARQRVAITAPHLRSSPSSETRPAPRLPSGCCPRHRPHPYHQIQQGQQPATATQVPPPKDSAPAPKSAL